jgi:hypothetical protein
MSQNPTVKGEPIYRDLNSGALVFTNKQEIQDYEAKRLKKQQKDNAMKSEINSLKESVAELKEG